MRKSYRKSAAIFAVIVFGVAAALVATGATASTSSKKASVRSASCCRTPSSSVRWVQFDAPDFAKALKAAGVTYSINNALNDPQKQKAQAAACLAAGAKVVIETMLDDGSAAAIENCSCRRAARRSTTTASFPTAPRPSYITFDGKSRRTGAGQGRSGRRSRASTKPVIAELWGGQTDQNAVWFKSGNDAS